MSSTATSRAVVYGALGAAVVLLLTAPTPAESVHRLVDAGSAVQATDPLVALLALLAWCCAAYLLAVAALTLGSRLPGVVGAALRVVVRRVAPAGLRRALEVALGVTLAVGTLGGGTAFAADPADGALHVRTAVVQPSVPAPVVATDPTAVPSLDHPLTPSRPAASATPSLDHPTTASPAQSPAASRPRAPEPAPAPAATAPTAAEQLVVRPGDTLWGLAEQQLQAETGVPPTDAQVAQEWPSWWQANREAVGHDPDLLRPGTPLVPPTAAPSPDS